MSVALVLCFCTRMPAQQDCASIAADATIAAVGAFSNMRYTEEHAYGFTVMLWRAGQCLFGLFERSQGLAGDTPIGELEQIKYDPASRALSFTAKLRTSDLYSFTGNLRAARLIGVVSYTSKAIENFTPVREKVVLHLSKAEGEFMPGTPTYADWRKKWEPILRFRGPRW